MNSRSRSATGGSPAAFTEAPGNSLTSTTPAEGAPSGMQAAGREASEEASNSLGLKIDKRRVRSSRPEVSMFGLRELWLVPFLGELLLMLGAGWLTYCLLRVVNDPKVGFPIASVLLLALAYAGSVVYSRLHELFLPRKVVFLGVGSLLFISLAASVSFMIDAFLLGGRPKLIQACLVLTPMHLFVLRCLLVFREARFTPSAEALTLRLRVKGEKLHELRRRIRFWLS